jgi:hypothetical protein
MLVAFAVIAGMDGKCFGSAVGTLLSNTRRLRPVALPSRRFAKSLRENPYAGRYVENLDEMIGASRTLGAERK